MKGIYIRILKFLYENDNGEYLNVVKAFKKNETPTRNQIERIFDDLKEYIELESIYNYKGIAGLEEKTIKETPLLKARINQKGRDYYIDQKSKNISITINKRNLFLVFVGIVLAFLTFYFTIINPVKQKTDDIVLDETTFPSPTVCLKNSTNDTAFFYLRQNFIIWFPVTAYGDAPNIAGTYEFKVDSKQIIKGMIHILPKSEMKLQINIENKRKFYQYFLQNENEIMIWLKTGKGQLYSSSDLPFNEKWISKYCMGLEIENKNAP